MRRLLSVVLATMIVDGGRRGWKSTKSESKWKSSNAVVGFGLGTCRIVEIMSKGFGGSVCDAARGEL